MSRRRALFPWIRNVRAASLALALLACAASPAGAQVKPELLENSGLTGDRNPAAPVPVRDPANPQKTLPKPRKPDVRKHPGLPSDVSKPGQMPPAVIRPGMNRPGLDDTLSRPQVDLALRIVEARFSRTGFSEIVVEISNRGPSDFEGKAQVNVNVDSGDVCHWPRSKSLPIPFLRHGDARRLVFPGSESGCDEGRRDRSRNAIRMIAQLQHRYLPGAEYVDRAPANDIASAWLGDVLRAGDAEPPATDRAVQLRLSNLVFRVSGGRGAVSEIKWIKLKIADLPEVKYSHDQLAILAHGNSGDRLPQSNHHLKVRSSDYIGAPHALTATAIVQEGERVELVLKVRDMDCAGDRDCNRGDTGTTTYAFNVPVTSNAFLGNCDRKEPFGSMDELIGSAQGSPHLDLDVVEGHETFKPMICFMPASGRGRF